MIERSLAHYRLTGLLGAGGMGEVYRARDTRLGRDVAIKVLPEDMAADASRLARFRREAQLLAALNHPNIAAIYDLDEDHVPPFLVLELVEGEDLAQRLLLAPISIAEAIGIARQIGLALEDAHEHGIVHRDLKPANIRVTASGTVKVLDFGLARAYSEKSSSDDPSATTAAGTHPGTILGTPAYMSPEQARGQALDSRADVWAFGAVLYEMLAGQRAFKGDNVGDTLAAVLTGDPDWAALPAGTPVAVRRLLRRCLTRDLKARLRDVGDARTILDREALGGTSEFSSSDPGTTAPVAAVPPRLRVSPWFLVIALALGIGLVARTTPASRSNGASPVRLSAGLGTTASLAEGLGDGLALSPDGGVLAFCARPDRNEPTRLYMRRLDQSEASPLPGTEGAESPFFSPDGRSIAFFANGALRKIALGGSGSVVVADAASGRGGWWADDGSIVLVPNFMLGTRIHRVPAEGGVAEPFPAPLEGDMARRFPQVLPGGRGILYTSHLTPSGFDDAAIVVQPLSDGPPTVIHRGGYHARYLPSGHVVFIQKGNLMALPFDLQGLAASGPPVTVLEGVVANPFSASAQFTFAENGAFAYLPGRAATMEAPIEWIERGGGSKPLRTTPADWTALRFSRDGSRIAMQIWDGGRSSIWIYEWALDRISRLTAGEGNHQSPVWTEDGEGMAFAYKGDGEKVSNIHWRRVDGTGEPQRLSRSPNNQQPTSFDPSGGFLAFMEQSTETSWDLGALPLARGADGSWTPGSPLSLSNTNATETQPVFSPDGRWIAYVSNESGAYEVYVRPFPGPGGRWQVSVGGGFYPQWSRGRREILYAASVDSQIMVAPYAVAGGSFRAEKPRPWSNVRVAGRRSARFFDVHPDGQRVAGLSVPLDPPSGEAAHLIVILNFFDELRRLAPPGKDRPVMLEEGTLLGPYRIGTPLGAGGMGAVYRAHDAQLGREVALKVLLEEVARDSDRFLRFRREAKVVAALNHPNIAAIYGLEEAEGRPFLVLELVEGENLARVISRGPLSLSLAIALAKQIAAGLDEAHEHGIIHRDLKPANIQVTPHGRVKILDFGLAKVFAEGPESQPLPLAITGLATKSGMTLGTPGYMSPEQTSAQAVDKRTDNWAFGVIFFEMLTGVRPFAGRTVGETLTAVLTRDPDWTALPAETPDLLKGLLVSCLVRDPRERLRDIGEARAVLDELTQEAGVLTPPPEPLPASRTGSPGNALRRAAPWLLSGVLAVVLAVTTRARLSVPDPPDRPTRFSAELGADASLVAEFGPGAIFAPDSASIAYTARPATGGLPRLYVRRLDQARASELPGTEGAESPFLAPDGKWIAFFADGRLKKTAATGGPVVSLADAPNGRGGFWSEDGTITFVPSYVLGAPLLRVPAAGGRAQSIDAEASDETARRWPQSIGGGRALLYTSHTAPSGFEDAEIVVRSLASGERRVIHKGGYHGRYVPTGHVVYISRGTLFAIPFDLGRLEATGPSVPVLEGIRSNPDNAGAQFTFSADGTLLYVPGKSLTLDAPIDWITPAGADGLVRKTETDWSGLHFSPDGRTLAMEISDGEQWDVWLYGWETDTLSRLTFDPAGDQMPAWTPDGKRIAFGSRRGDGKNGNLYWQRADGTGEVARLTESPLNQMPVSWHLSGRFLSFVQESPQTTWDLMMLPMEGSEASGWTPGKPFVFLSSKAVEYEPVFSPDGKWLAYFSNESGRYEVYVRPFPGPGGKWQVSTQGGVYPTWSRSRPELLFLATADLQVMVAPFESRGESFRPGKARPWSGQRIMGRRVNRAYDLHPDGRRIAAARVDESQFEARHVTLIFNFFDELRLLAPAGGPRR